MTLPFYHLRNSQKIQFLDDVVSLGSEYDLEVMNLNVEFTNLSATLIDVDVGFKATLGSEFTERIVGYDFRRDNSMKCVYGVARAFKHHHLEAKAHAGELVFNKVRKYGSQVYAMNMVEETKILSAIVSELKDESMTPYLVELGLVETLVEMEESNNLLNALWIERMKEKSEEVHFTTTQLINNAIKSFVTLRTKVEALHLVAPTENINLLHQHIMELLEEYSNL